MAERKVINWNYKGFCPYDKKPCIGMNCMMFLDKSSAGKGGCTILINHLAILSQQKTMNKRLKDMQTTLDDIGLFIMTP